MLQVDQRHEAILVPIYGVLTPFHILTLKNATVNQAHSPLLWLVDVISAHAS